jgi:hypothetical protein
MSLIQRGRSKQEIIVDGTLLEAQGADTAGTWQNIERIVPWSITIRGTFVATVTIYVSNQVTRPTDSDNAHAPFQAYTAADSGGSTIPFRWIKARVSNYASGSVTVDLIGGA